MTPAVRRGGRLGAWIGHEVRRLRDVVGGPARLKVIFLLACVLGLETADVSSVGAVAVPLERGLHIGNVELGLLVTVSTAIGAAATLPVGVMVDRLNRTRVLTISILLWCLAELASAASQSYLWLLLTRLALGAVVAAAAPAVASLTGDLFQVAERGRIYGYILTGELVGAGLGIEISGTLGGLTWRASFAWLVIPGAALAFAIWRYLPEPARGGLSRMAEGAETVPAAEDVADGTVPAGTLADDGKPGAPSEVEEKVEDQDVAAREPLILRTDPTGRSLWWAVRYVLAVPTNRLLVVSSALGYFYFQGMQTFAVEFLRGRFGLGQSLASLLLLVIGVGAIAGALLTGRLADRLITLGHIPGRVLVAGFSFLAAVALFVPGLLTPTPAAAIPLFFAGAAALGGVNSPLDAARLDIMHSRLWGRAEAVRTFLRTSLVAVAPLVFGLVSTQFGGSGGSLGQAAGPVAPGAPGLDLTFLIMLAPVAAAGLIVLATRRTYPRDAATAIASEHATRPPDTSPAAGTPAGATDNHGFGRAATG